MGGVELLNFAGKWIFLEKKLEFLLKNSSLEWDNFLKIPFQPQILPGNEEKEN